MSSIPNRIIIYPKDIVNITGRKHLGKQSKHPITLEEFCTYYNLNPETIKPFLK